MWFLEKKYDLDAVFALENSVRAHALKYYKMTLFNFHNAETILKFPKSYMLFFKK